MSIENIVVLTVLMYFGIYNLIQAEVTRGIDIPSLDITRILGKWYLLVLHKENNIACMTLTVEPRTEYNFVINVNLIPTREAIQEDPTMPNEYVGAINCVTRINSNIIICNDEDQFTIAMVAFDMDYDHYLAFYATDTEYEITTTGTDGGIFIVGRETTLTDAIIERVKQSSFYQQVVNQENVVLISINNSECQF